MPNILRIFNIFFRFSLKEVTGKVAANYRKWDVKRKVEKYLGEGNLRFSLEFNFKTSNLNLTQDFHPHPHLLPSREKGLK
jgi:hypothetical protein